VSTYIPSAPTLSEAWADTLEVVSNGGGRLIHVLTTVADPSREDRAIRRVVDDLLVPGRRGGTTIRTVETVANTIFPFSLYRELGFQWRPGMAQAAADELDSVARDLYDAYTTMLPVLLTADGNHNGTYFGRMVSWPGTAAGGPNQVADRIRYLRVAHENGQRANNMADIAVGGEGDIAPPTDFEDIGLQTYAATDRRQRGFPCLVHVDLTVLDGKLSMLAVYRHQYLVTKAYGNLVGLSRLLRFLAQQTGYEVGELAVQATLADDERGTFGGRDGIDDLVGQIRGARSRGVVE
jgi:hypothetical protein